MRSSRTLRAAPAFCPLGPSHLRVAAPRLATRWYSDASDAAKKPEEASKEGEAVKESEDPVKKELEAKNKEIVELKVR